MTYSKITVKEILARIHQHLADEKINPSRAKYKELILIEAEKHV